MVFLKKYWSIFVLALIIWSCTDTKNYVYNCKTKEGINLKVHMKEPRWMFWIHSLLSSSIESE